MSSTCISCEFGTYATAYGKSTCTVCPVGKTTLLRGAQNSSNCLCRAGYFRKDDGSGGCGLCAPGKYTDRTGQSECTSAPKGTYTLLRCPIGTRVESYSTYETIEDTITIIQQEGCFFPESCSDDTELCPQDKEKCDDSETSVLGPSTDNNGCGTCVALENLAQSSDGGVLGCEDSLNQCRLRDLKRQICCACE